jgi:hypothetical protein
MGQRRHPVSLIVFLGKWQRQIYALIRDLADCERSRQEIINAFSLMFSGRSDDRAYYSLGCLLVTTLVLDVMK